MVKNCSVLILAAGNAERMGFPKLLLQLKPSYTFLEHIVDQYYRFGCRDIVCVLNPLSSKLVTSKLITITNRVKIAINPHPEKGRFASVKIGLSETNINSPVFIHNIDNPFASQSVLNDLYNKCFVYEFAYPTCNGRGGHPVIISPQVKSEIIEEVSSDLRLDIYLKKYNGFALEVDDNRILLNINNNNDYQKMVEQFPEI